MKKLISLLLILTTFALIFVSCNSADSYTDQEKESTHIASTTEEVEVDHYTESAIKSNFSKYINKSLFNGENKTSPDDIEIKNDYGKIGKFNIYQMKSSKVDLEDYIKSHRVGNFSLKYLRDEPTYLYLNGDFYTIEEAYNLKLIKFDFVVEYAKKISFSYLIDLADTEKDKKLDQKTFTEMKVAYAELTENFDALETMSVNYIGDIGYKDYVIEIDGDGKTYNQSVRKENIAGYEIVFPSSKPIYIYCDGLLLTLSEAFEKGKISKSRVYGFAYMVGLEITENGKTPLHPEDTKDIDYDLAMEMKAAWVSQYQDELIIGSYYKIGDNHIIAKGTLVAWGFETRDIAGYRITHSYIRSFYVYKDGKFYLLADAYENGVLSKDDVYQFAIKTGGTVEEIK